MSRRRRAVVATLAAMAVVGALGYLYNPPWLADYTTGLQPWDQDSDGVRYRWTKARASLYVPASAGRIDVPLAALFRTEDRSPFVVDVRVDGIAAGRAVLADQHWTHLTIRMPRSRTWRRFRRLDISVNRTWEYEGYGVKLGEISTWPQ
jgi:hypothetical protein